MGKRRDKTTRLVNRLKKRAHRVKELAISIDPNQTLKAQSVKDELTATNVVQPKVRDSKRRDNLEKMANRPPAKRYRYGTEISKFCAYMIAKHGNNYKAMEKDSKNHYQESAGSLKRMMLKFKGFKVNQNAYLLAEKMCEEELCK